VKKKENAEICNEREKNIIIARLNEFIVTVEIPNRQKVIF
jgi:hypothetical protein